MPSPKSSCLPAFPSSTRGSWALLAIAIFALPYSLFATATPAPPEDQILDEAHLLTPEQKSHIHSELAETLAEHDLKIYLALYSYLSEGSAKLQAIKLAKEWIPEDVGMVVAYERGSNQVSIASSPSMAENLNYPRIQQATAQAVKDLPTNANPAERVTMLIQNLSAAMDETFTSNRKANSLFNKNTLIIVGTLLLLTLLGTLFFRHLSSRATAASNSTKRRLFFPTVDVPQRFGAPQGGGTCSTEGAASPSESQQQQHSQPTAAPTPQPQNEVPVAPMPQTQPQGAISQMPSSAPLTSEYPTPSQVATR